MGQAVSLSFRADRHGKKEPSTRILLIPTVCSSSMSSRCRTLLINV